MPALVLNTRPISALHPSPDSHGFDDPSSCDFSESTLYLLPYFLTFALTSKIVKSTPRGQITLPKQWRGLFSTDHYLVKMDGSKLIIMPLRLDMASTEEEVLFDADRDNGGKGVSPDDMIRILKKIRKHG